jgi:hypothetical protein
MDFDYVIVGGVGRLRVGGRVSADPPRVCLIEAPAVR